MSEEQPKVKKPRKFKDATVPLKYQMIDRLVEIPESKLAQRTFYPRELKIAHILWQKYSQDFWTKVTLDYKLKSLAFLMCDRGAEEIEKKWKEFNFVPPSSVSTTYEATKIGEDLPVAKPPNLLDFLKRRI